MKTINIKVPDDTKAISITVISSEGNNSFNIGAKCFPIDLLKNAIPVFNGLDVYLEPKRRK